MAPDIAPVAAQVLVVDDDDAVRRSLKFMLELEGLDVRAYASGAALLNDGDLPAQGCLVVDQHMPHMSGVELVNRLRARNVCLPAILVTADLTADLSRKAAEAGVAVVFEKPIYDCGLIAAIRNALSSLKDNILSE